MKTVGLIISLILSASTPFCAEEWKPFSLPPDRSPIDLAFLLDAPAGKHGFLGVKDNRFVFEDGKEIRFWGTTLSGSACFPPQNLAPILAERLSRLGFNLVRFHDLDAPWVVPGLIDQRDENNIRLNPEALDRLDYLLYQLENRGIYAYLDGLDSRRPPHEPRADDSRETPTGMKGVIHFVPELQSLHEDYLEALWSHRNRYTHREYRDMPSIALTDLFHENDLSASTRLPAVAAQWLDGLWFDWCRQQGLENRLDLDRTHPTSDMRRFLSEMTMKSHVSFANYLRAISVKIPIAGTDVFQDLGGLNAVWGLDFIGVHGFWNDSPRPDKWFADRKMAEVDLAVESHLFAETAFARLKDKPLILSEWGSIWPNTNRAELPLWTAAMACFQDWRGCVSSPYLTHLDADPGFINGPFDLFNDPSLVGLFPAAALLFLRRDVDPAAKTVRMGVMDDDLYSETPFTPRTARPPRLVERMRVEVELGKKTAGSKVLSPSQPADLNDRRWQALRKSGLRHDAERGLVLIDTPRTQAMIGRLQTAKPDDLSLLRVESKEDFGVVCVTSLDGRAIPAAEDLWVTIVSQARNRGFSARAEESGFVVIRSGTSPILIKDTPVNLAVRSKHSDWSIHTLDGGGKPGEAVPYQIQGEWLLFRGGVHGTLFYRLSCSTMNRH